MMILYFYVMIAMKLSRCYSIEYLPSIEKTNLTLRNKTFY